MTKSEDLEIKEKTTQLKRKFQNEKSSIFVDDPDVHSDFLEACNYNLEQAEAMLKKHLEWRKKWEVDKLINETILSEEIVKYLPHSIIGLDKAQTQVLYIQIGSIDVKGCLSAIKPIDRMKYTIQVLEQQRKFLAKQKEKLGKHTGGIVCIIDMKNLTFAKATNKRGIEVVIQIAKCFQENYPGHLKVAITINASPYSSIAFSMVKCFLASSIVNKIRIYQSMDEWKPALLELIDADVLPAFLGGNKTDPDGDPMCKSFVRHGLTVPTRLYITKDSKSLAKSKDAKKIVLGRASFSEIELEVKEPGSVIEWEFETKTRDIGFGLFLTETDEDGEEKITELVPLLRLETDLFSETGIYKCEKAGKYVILFDNSYSWMRSKEIYYKANVILPNEHEKEIENSNV